MLDELEAVLRSTGHLLLSMGEAARRGQWEGDQLKTEADQLSHAALSEGLAAISPSTPIISEEAPDSHRAERPARYWIIDPLDGTRSFVDGFSGYVTQAALMEDGVPVLGGVFAPVLDDMYLARKGAGATLNGAPLHTRDENTEHVLVDNYPEPRGIAEAAWKEVGFQRYVECGSIGLKICKIADGSGSLTFKDVVIRDWDVAPADLIVREAGGVFVTLQGEPFVYQGDFNKIGFVAASGMAGARRIVDWFAARAEKGYA